MARIFVYGTLKRGCCRADVLRDQRFVGQARTAARYRLYETGTYPAMVEDEAGLAVEGEIWEVDERCLALLDRIEGVPALYQRKPVAIDDPPGIEADSYVYQESVAGLADCGCCWQGACGPGDAAVPDAPLFLAESHGETFAARAAEIDVVSAGDSITGWNNFGPPDQWPFPTYPRFLQVLASPRGLRIADCGIAGEVSANGLGHVARHLDLFPHSRYFVVGFGTNDLGLADHYEEASRHVIANLARMVEAIRQSGKQPVLLGVPHVKESLFVAHEARRLHEGREYHNGHLRAFCRRESIPLADICPVLGDDDFGDHVHPNEHGARRIAEVVFGVLC